MFSDSDLGIAAFFFKVICSKNKVGHAGALKACGFCICSDAFSLFKATRWGDNEQEND